MSRIVTMPSFGAVPATVLVADGIALPCFAERPPHVLAVQHFPRQHDVEQAMFERQRRIELELDGRPAVIGDEWVLIA